jgi:tetratricopeptide (TPR) repeat protein
MWEYNKITEINNLKSAAEEAYQSDNYYLAQRNYYHLVTTYKVKDDKVLLNLANSCFHNGFLKQAFVFYSLLKEKSGHEIHSIALTQMGVIASAEGKFNKSLEYFKKALTLNPKNEEARYNFELLKKYSMAHSKKTKASNTAKNGEKKSDGKEGSSLKIQPGAANGADNNSNKNTDNHKDANNGEKLTLQKFEEIKLNLEKAKEIMDMMDKQEIQYIQQLKKSGAHRPEHKFRNY